MGKRQRQQVLEGARRGGSKPQPHRQQDGEQHEHVALRRAFPPQCGRIRPALRHSRSTSAGPGTRRHPPSRTAALIPATTNGNETPRRVASCAAFSRLGTAMPTAALQPQNTGATAGNHSATIQAVSREHWPRHPRQRRGHKKPRAEAAPRHEHERQHRQSAKRSTSQPHGAQRPKANTAPAPKPITLSAKPPNRMLAVNTRRASGGAGSRARGAAAAWNSSPPATSATGCSASHPRAAPRSPGSRAAAPPAAG